MQKGELNIPINDFDYDLPQERIANFPLEQRDKAKLLVLKDGKLSDKVFSDLPNILDKETLLIYNDTKVVHARLFFSKDTGSVIEIFCLEPIEPKEIQLAFSQKAEGYWKCFVGNNKKWKEGLLTKSVEIEEKVLSLNAEKIRQEDNAWVIKFSWSRDYSFAEVLSNMGVIPLPPYIKRGVVDRDNQDYQTIYANEDGSVAAPTAGLHFTEETFRRLNEKGIESDFVTLHVGAGTFKPVNTEYISDHIMHTEKISIPKHVIQNLIFYYDKTIICVGTTSVRTIETLYWHGVKLLEGNSVNEINISQWEPYQKEIKVNGKEALETILKKMEEENLDTIHGETQIIIAPSYKYRIVKGMITNFHQPKSTLLLLVSAMIGDKWRDSYNFALEKGYRFLSFGDACFFSDK